MTTLYLIVCGIGIVACIRFLAWLCKPVRHVELMRWAGNDAGLRGYEARRDALGYGARARK